MRWPAPGSRRITAVPPCGGRHLQGSIHNFRAKARKRPSASVEVNPLHAFELVALRKLDFRHFSFLDLQGLADIANIPDQPAQSIRLQRGGMVGSLPGPVQREMPFNPGCPQNDGRNVDGNAEMMARKSDLLDARAEPLIDFLDFEQADLVKRNRIAGCACVQHDPAGGTALLHQLHDLLLLSGSGHAYGY